MSHIFGYGSLSFRPPPFASLSTKPLDNIDLIPRAGYIKGYVRRFAQESHDHRGTEDAPGRGRLRILADNLLHKTDDIDYNPTVVTLVTADEWSSYQTDDPMHDGVVPIVWGSIYAIPQEQESSEAVWEYLDHREKDGYSLKEVDVFSIVDGVEVMIERACKVYVGETTNPSFAPATTMDVLSSIIATSEGPSGLNRDYLFALTKAIRKISLVEDSYLSMLDNLVRQKIATAIV